MKKYTTEIFIKNAKKVHGEHYDYSLVDYKNYNTKVKIICPVHDIFEQDYENHIKRGHGCPECFITKKINNTRIYKKC